jgi:hypothetical protein
MSMGRRFTTIFFTTALVLATTAALAQDEELGEAVGLEPAVPDPENQPGGATVAETKDKIGATSLGDSLRWRAYGLIDWRGRHTLGRDKLATNGPNAEVGAAVDAALTPRLAVFTEGRGLYDDESEHTYGIFDQGGLRYRPTDELVVALGKERNRRAPGMIVSPSDFIHSNAAVPGLREERGGVWLGRLSWQTQVQSADLIALPVARQRESGLPAADNEYAGTAARYFRRLPAGIDLGLDVGQLDDDMKAGAFLQAIAAQIWKVYAETGYDEATESSSHLAGIGYEGSGTYSLRVEWYGRDESWVPPSPLVADRSYVIASAAAAELLDRFNLTDTVVRSLDSESHFNVARAEWLVSDRQVAGAALIHLEPALPFRWQLIADWKLSL